MLMFSSKVNDFCDGGQVKLFQIQGLLDASKVLVINHADFAFNAIFAYVYLGIFRLKNFLIRNSISIHPHV